MTKPIEQNLEEGLRNLNNRFMVLHKKPLGVKPIIPSGVSIQENIPIKPVAAPEVMFNKNYDKYVSMFKKIGLVVAIAIVAMYATWRFFA